MPRIFGSTKSRNLWGIGAEDALEAQRQDLWLVDFDSAVSALNQSVGGSQAALPALPPQVIQTITLPEQRVKADVYRRDSLPYQMPSWDEPLEAIKISFILDVPRNGAVPKALEFLRRWLEQVRAGRGTRALGYDASPVLLNADYRVDYAFHFHLVLLRGSVTLQTFSAPPAPLVNQSITTSLER